MKKLSIIAAVATMALATQLNALTIAQSFGAVDPATPANATSEVSFINHLLTLSPVGENAPSFPPLLDEPVFDGNDYDRFDTVLPVGAPTSITSVGGLQGQAPSSSVNVTGFNYLLAKFGTTGYVWYVGNLSGSQSLPLDLGQAGGQSHFSLYGLTGGNITTVPDGGATVALLGLALGALALVRRKLA